MDAAAAIAPSEGGAPHLVFKPVSRSRVVVAATASEAVMTVTDCVARR